MNKIFEKCKKTRILAAIGLVCMFMGTIFPYITYSILGYGYSLSLWDYLEGKIIIAIIIANLIFIFKDYVEKYVPKLVEKGFWKKISDIKNPKASLVLTFLSVAIAIYLTFGLDFYYFKFSFGFYLLWIGAISLVAYAFVHKEDMKSEKNNETNNVETSDNDAK